MRDIPLNQLPEELVAHVLRRVELQQRLGSCSLICKAWRAAAVAATSNVRMSSSSQPLPVSRFQSLELWLSHHAAAVTQLEVDNRGRVAGLPYIRQVLQLPFAQLQRLQDLTVLRCNLQQEQQQQQQQLSGAQRTRGSSSSSIGQLSLSCLTSLTALQLSSVRCSGLGGLSAVTGLQALRLANIYTVSSAAEQKQQLRIDILQSLRRLTQLTQLVLQDDLLPPGAAAPFSCLQQLQELTMNGDVTSAETLLGLPQSLTTLHFTWCSKQELNSSVCADLAALTQLQHLYVHSFDDRGGYDADDQEGGVLLDFCSSMQQLRVLELHGRLAVATLPTLVHVIPSLSCLESLVVSNRHMKLALPAHVAGCSALLPLSLHLTNVELSWDVDEDFKEGSILRRNAGRHVFAAGRVLPQLKQLVLGVPAAVLEWVDDADVYGSYVSCVGTCLAEPDVARIVGCCPGLERLWMAGLVQRGVDMSLLLQLTALTDLCIGGEVVNNDVASSVLAQLTGLRSLGVYESRSFDDIGLLALTALQQLTRLAVGNCGISFEVSNSFAVERIEGLGDDEGECLELEKKVRSGTAYTFIAVHAINSVAS
jgi:hypothetical protein